MLTIRLARGGAKKRPYYSIVVTDSRNARDSGAIKEKVGYFNPMARGNELTLHMDMDRINHWVATGAQKSDKVSQLVKMFVKSQESGEKASMRTRTSLTEKKKNQEKARLATEKEAKAAASKAEQDEKQESESSSDATDETASTEDNK